MTINDETTAEDLLANPSHDDWIRPLQATGQPHSAGHAARDRAARRAAARTVLTAPEPEPRSTTGERRVRELAQRIASDLPSFADALASLIDLAEEQDEPRMHRYAALCRSRVEPMLSVARELRAATSDGREEPARSRPPVDLRTVVSRAVDGARAATGTDGPRLDVGNVPLRVRRDPADLERSVTHLVVTAVHHAGGDAPVHLRLAESSAGGAHGEPDAMRRFGTLSMVAEDCTVSSAELARIVSRFHAATYDETSDEALAPARIRISGGSVIAESGTVRAEASRDGRLLLQAQWHLNPEVHAV